MMVVYEVFYILAIYRKQNYIAGIDNEEDCTLPIRQFRGCVRLLGLVTSRYEIYLKHLVFSECVTWNPLAVKQIQFLIVNSTESRQPNRECIHLSTATTCDLRTIVYFGTENQQLSQRLRESQQLNVVLSLLLYIAISSKALA
jgi:hypothetical protein